MPDRDVARLFLPRTECSRYRLCHRGPVCTSTDCAARSIAVGMPFGTGPPERHGGGRGCACSAGDFGCRNALCLGVDFASRHGLGLAERRPGALAIFIFAALVISGLGTECAAVLLFDVYCNGP